VPQGKVKWFSSEKAFGFIEQENDNDIFVHVTGLADGVTVIDKDQLVEYEVEQGRKGPQATNVRPASGAAAAAPAAPEAEAEAEVDEVEVVEVEEVEVDVAEVDEVEVDEVEVDEVEGDESEVDESEGDEE
jgi:CspA family cold shock protein